MPSFVMYLVHTLFPHDVLRPTELGADVMIIATGVAIFYVLTKQKNGCTCGENGLPR